MPIYEYRCERCETEFEELVFGADEEVVCPKCGTSSVERKMSAFAFKSGGKFVASGDSGCASCHSSSCSSCKH